MHVTIFGKVEQWLLSTRNKTACP